MFESESTSLAVRPAEAGTALTSRDPAAIVKSFANTNGVLSGAMSLVPGPWGMAAAIPEIAIVMRNQLTMIEEIAAASGKQAILTRELKASILLSGLGGSAGALMTMHGSRVLVRKTALRGFQTIVSALAGKVTQQAVKSMVGKWVPVLGAAAMAAWSRYTTSRIGQKATEIFQKDIVLLDELVEAEEVIDSEAIEGEWEAASEAELEHAGTTAASRLTTTTRLQALIELMRVDGEVHRREREFLMDLIGGAGLEDSVRDELCRSIESGARREVDFALLTSRPADAVALLIDMVGLAQRDGRVDVRERMYIRQSARLMGLSDQDVTEALGAPA